MEVLIVLVLLSMAGKLIETNPSLFAFLAVLGCLTIVVLRVFRVRGSRLCAKCGESSQTDGGHGSLDAANHGE